MAAALVLNSGLNYKNYTLHENGNWISTKTNMRGLNGGYACLFTKTALSKNRLNIASWFGYQEFLYNKKISPSCIRFKYLSPTNSPFSLILQRTDSLTYGFYFNYKNDSICCFYIANNEGQLLHKEIFYSNLSGEQRWNAAEATCGADSVELKINGRSFLKTACKLQPVGLVGFRGGSRVVYVDDLSVTDAHGNCIIQENFSPRTRWNRLTLWFLVIFGGCIFLFRKPSRQFGLIVINASLLIGLVVSYWVYFHFLSDRYQTDESGINWHGETISYDFVDVVSERMSTQHPFDERKPVILVMGSSQTWGAGTTQPDRTYPARIETNLRNYFQDNSITVLNAGVCGFASTQVYNHYVDEWYQHHPLLTIIDLANNDTNLVLFRENMRRLLEFNQSGGIKTLLVAEPNDYLNDEMRLKYEIIKDEGDRFYAKTLFMQDYIDSCFETGFLWWDNVHMTDFGYQLLAERITPEVIKMLEQDSLLVKYHSAISD